MKNILKLSDDEKKIHNKKVDLRRKKIKKFAGKTGKGLKKIWDYLGETKLANPDKETMKKKKQSDIDWLNPSGRDYW